MSKTTKDKNKPEPKPAPKKVLINEQAIEDANAAIGEWEAQANQPSPQETIVQEGPKDFFSRAGNKPSPYIVR